MPKFTTPAPYSPTLPLRFLLPIQKLVYIQAEINGEMNYESLIGGLKSFPLSHSLLVLLSLQAGQGMRSIKLIASIQKALALNYDPAKSQSKIRSDEKKDQLTFLSPLCPYFLSWFFVFCFVFILGLCGGGFGLVTLFMSNCPFG